MTSLVPELFDSRVLISASLVVLLMLGNLRGIRESGTIFMIPTYAYIVVMLGIIDLLPMVRTVVGGTGVSELAHLFAWSDAGS